MRALPIGAVPLLPPAGAAPLRGRELREIPHTGALPDGLVPDAHAEELDGPRRAGARVVAVVPALRAPPGTLAPGAGRRRRRRRHAVTRHGWGGWIGREAALARVGSGWNPFFPLSSRDFFYLSYPDLLFFIYFFGRGGVYLFGGREKQGSRSGEGYGVW